MSIATGTGQTYYAIGGVANAGVLWTEPNGYQASASAEDPHVAAWLAAGHEPAAAAPPTPNEQFAAAIAAGCRIVSTGTPAIDGAYGIQPQDEINYSGLQAGIFAGAPWIGGIRDIAGVKHAMSVAEATAVFTAILGYVEAWREWLANGGVGPQPAQPVMIA